jgi:hypothetical protein
MILHIQSPLGVDLEIPKGDFYDCNPDTERLTHESPEDALVYWIDSLCTPGCDVSALVREHTPVTVYVHNRGEVSQRWLDSMVQNTLERVGEEFVEEYGDPDGLCDDDLVAELEVKAKLREALSEFVATGNVWHCEKVAEVTLDADQVEGILRKHNPNLWVDRADSTSTVDRHG